MRVVRVHVSGLGRSLDHPGDFHGRMNTRLLDGIKNEKVVRLFDPLKRVDADARSEAGLTE